MSMIKVTMTVEGEFGLDKEGLEMLGQWRESIIECGTIVKEDIELIPEGKI